MSDGDSSTSASLTEGEGGREGEVAGRQSPATSVSSFSSSLRAVVRIKQKYLAMKKRRQEALLGPGPEGAPLGAPGKTSPRIFTFDGLPPFSNLPQKKKKKRRKRVLYPNRGGRRAPPKQEQSRAKYCLYLLCAIVFLQVYNAIENLDDHVLRYDLEGLEKTLRREVFGQQGAVDGLLFHLKDYLSTYVHNKPLVVSLHGPSGVGKSHLGRLLAGHFRSVVGETLVLQYYVLHHCPQEADALRCARDLSALVSETVGRAEEEEKIPLFVFDEAEHMHGEILDALLRLVAAERSNEHLNAVYLLLSNLGPPARHQARAAQLLRRGRRPPGQPGEGADAGAARLPGGAAPTVGGGGAPAPGPPGEEPRDGVLPGGNDPGGVLPGPCQHRAPRGGDRILPRGRGSRVLQDGLQAGGGEGQPAVRDDVSRSLNPERNFMRLQRRRGLEEQEDGGGRTGCCGTRGVEPVV
uniref:Torsin family 4, member Aa n=1 Tax=Gasterosteus aculeatus aculeatus TaxID=481459 RepID=A0AAQ4R5U0_GASAC